MKILKLELENFRGIKELSLDLAGNDCCIFGTNGSGKTTVGNAIGWILTGGALTGEKNFSPKTADAHNLHHKVAMTVELDDGSQTTFAKDYYETWTKKKGASIAELTGHTTDCTINGVPAKEKDYTAAIEAACGGPGEKIKILTMLGYFAETMDTNGRRKILFDVCGDVDDADVYADERLMGLKERLVIPGTHDQYYHPDQLKAIATKQVSKLKADIKALPARIDELVKSMPEPIDKVALSDELKELQGMRDELIAQSKAETSAALIKGFSNELEAERSKYHSTYAEKNKDVESKITELMGAIAKGERLYSETQLRIQKTEFALREMRARREQLLQDWKKVVEAGKWDASSETCPTCGQALPEEKIDAMKTELFERTATRKAEIQAKGQECSQGVIQELEDELVGEQEKAEEYKLYLAGYEKKIEELKHQIVEAPDFATTEKYKEITAKIEKFRKQAEDNRGNELIIADLDKRIAKVNEALASEAMADKLHDRIAKLEESQHEMATELEKAEHTVFLCEEFTRVKVGMVTGKINSHFKTIGFQLFKEQINGGIKECCEPLIPNKDGVYVEYKSANTAAKVNAGLEIISVLSKHYGMDLPIIIDQAESVCHPMAVEQQTIRLVVSAEDEALRIKVIEKE